MMSFSSGLLKNSKRGKLSKNRINGDLALNLSCASGLLLESLLLMDIHQSTLSAAC